MINHLNYRVFKKKFKPFTYNVLINVFVLSKVISEINYKSRLHKKNHPLKVLLRAVVESVAKKGPIITSLKRL